MPSFSEVKSAEPVAPPRVLEPRRKLTAEELVERFNIPMKPPAPQPDLRAASDGGMFVAHYAVMDPARSMDTPAPVPSVMFEEHTIPSPETLAEASLSEDQRAFKAQILATSMNVDSRPPSDVPGFGTTKTTFGRRHRSSVAWGLLGALLALLLIAAGLMRPKPSESTGVLAGTPVVRASAAPGGPTIGDSIEHEGAHATPETPPESASASRPAQGPSRRNDVPSSSAPPSVSRASAPRTRPVVTTSRAVPAASTLPSTTDPSDFPLGPQ